MNTIYDGTYVIGQTSATNFVAGPGIKIDEPSAGTVRIGTDETVLWSGNATTACTLTESPSAFDRIRFYGYRNEGSIANSRGVFEFPTEGMTGYDLSQLLYDNGCNYRALYLSRYAITGTNCTLEKAQHLYAATGNNAWQGQGTCEILIYKIVGINRINRINA